MFSKYNLKYKKKIQTCFFVLLVMLIVTPSFSFAQPAQLYDPNSFGQTNWRTQGQWNSTTTPVTQNNNSSTSTTSQSTSSTGTQPPRAIVVDESKLGNITTPQTGQNGQTGQQGGAATSISSCLAAGGLVGIVQNAISTLAGAATGFLRVSTQNSVQEGKETGVLGTISWDQIGWCLANAAIDQISAATVAWINGGFQGSPVFVQDPAQFFTDIADQQAGAFLGEISGGLLCGPIQNVLRVNLANTYNSQISPYGDRAQCSFSSIAGNFEQFTSGQSFSWKDWFSYTQVPQNNEMGATIFGQIELDRRVTAMLGLEKNKLDWSGGFFSIKDPETGKITTPGKVVEDQINQKLFSGQKRLEVADEFNEVVTALVNQLINMSIGKMMGADSGFGSSLDGTGWIDSENQAATYTVTFDGNGSTGGTMSNQNFKEGYPSNIKQNQFTKTGFKFLGWNTSADGNGTMYANGSDFTIGAENTMLYAIWTDQPIFTLTVRKIGNGAVQSAPSGIRCGENCVADFVTGSEVLLTATPNTGNLFKGWTGGGCATNNTTTCRVTLDQARSVTATFIENTLNVSFEGNGAEGFMPVQPFTEGESKLLPANQFTRSEYQFIGWATSANGPVAYLNRATYIMGDESIILYAKWAPARYTINFRPNGANSGNMSPIDEITPVQTVTLPPNRYRREGHTFDGWATSKDGDVEYTNEQQISNMQDNLTLHAKWSTIQKTLSFDAHGGSGTMLPLTFTPGQGIPLPANTFRRTGYTFKGWATSPQGDIEYTNSATFSSTASSDVILYAKWEAN